MVFVLGNLPDGVKKRDIRSLVGHHKACKVKFLREPDRPHSKYECLVDVDVIDPIAGSFLEDNLNHTHWRGSIISAHRLIF